MLFTNYQKKEFSSVLTLNRLKTHPYGVWVWIYAQKLIYWVVLGRLCVLFGNCQKLRHKCKQNQNVKLTGDPRDTCRFSSALDLSEFSPIVANWGKHHYQSSLSETAVDRQNLIHWGKILTWKHFWASSYCSGRSCPLAKYRQTLSVLLELFPWNKRKLELIEWTRRQNFVNMKERNSNWKFEIRWKVDWFVLVKFGNSVKVNTKPLTKVAQGKITWKQILTQSWIFWDWIIFVNIVKIFNYCFSSSYLVSSVIFSPDFSLAIKNTTETFCTRFSVTYCNQVSLTPCLSLKASTRKEKFREIAKINFSNIKKSFLTNCGMYYHQ